MILTYSTLILASLIAAMLALFFYRLISHATKSASRARKRQNQASNIHAEQKAHAWRRAVGNVATSDAAQTSPAMPAGNHSQNNVWPYREKRLSTVGSAYKVRRKTTGGNPGAKYTRTPWGW